MIAYVNTGPSHAARVELLKERPKPFRVLVVNADGFFERPGVISKPLGHKSPHPLMQIYCRTFLLPLIQIIIMRIKKAARVSGWRVVRFWIFRLDLTRSACARTTTGGSISNRNWASNCKWFTQERIARNDECRIHPKHYSTETMSRAKRKLLLRSEER